MRMLVLATFISAVVYSGPASAFYYRTGAAIPQWFEPFMLLGWGLNSTGKTTGLSTTCNDFNSSAHCRNTTIPRW